MTFTFYGRPLSKNRAARSHWAANRRVLVPWKERAHWAAVQLGAVYVRCVVTVQPYFPHHGQDAGNDSPTYQAVVDGLAAGGLFGTPKTSRDGRALPGAGDGADHVVRVVSEAGIVAKGQRCRLEVTVRDA